MLNHYVAAFCVTAATHFVLAVFVFLKGRYRLTNITYALYSLSIAWWSCFEAFSVTRVDGQTALLWWRVNHVGVIFIPIFFSHFVVSLLTPHERRSRKPLLIGAYVLGGVFLALNATPFLIPEVVPKFSFHHFINPGRVYKLFFGLWVGLACYGLIELFRLYARSSGAKRNQFAYFCWSMAIAYLGGIPNFLPTFEVEIPYLMPFGTYAIPAYALVTAYAIVRYHLLDIRVALTRGVIFVAVYGLTVTFPLLFAAFTENWFRAFLGDRWWLVPYGILSALSAAWPLIYQHFQRQAEDQLLKKERQYQAAIRTMAQELVGFHDAKRLCEFVGRYVAEQMGLRAATLLACGNHLALS